MAKSLYVRISTTAQNVNARSLAAEKAYQIGRALRHEARNFILVNKLGSDRDEKSQLETEIMEFLLKHIVVRELEREYDTTYEISFEEK